MTTSLEKEVIVEVGVEGVSLALLGVRNDAGRRYSLYVNDWTPELLDQEPIQRESDQVVTWDAPIALLDRYPWREFFPIRVHPEFRVKLWAAVRGKIGDSADYPRPLEDWEAVCKGGGDEVSEYRDASFLERIGLKHLLPDLKEFWPVRGPQWDALARFDKGGVILVEAKAHGVILLLKR